MDVYRIKYVGGYGGGMALVAADSDIEAMEVFLEHDSYARMSPEDYECYECIDGLSWYGSSPEVICSSFYIE